MARGALGAYGPQPTGCARAVGDIRPPSSAPGSAGRGEHLSLGTARGPYLAQARRLERERGGRRSLLMGTSWASSQRCSDLGVPHDFGG